MSNPTNQGFPCSKLLVQGCYIYLAKNQSRSEGLEDYVLEQKLRATEGSFLSFVMSLEETNAKDHQKETKTQIPKIQTCSRDYFKQQLSYTSVRMRL